MKRSELFFTAVLVPLDYAVFVLSACIAYQVRYLETVQDIRPVIFDLNFFNFLYSVLVFSAIWVGIFAITGLYRANERRSGRDEFGKIFVACSAGIAVVVAAMFFSRYLFDSRFIILASWVLSIVFVSIERFSVRELQRRLYAKGVGLHRAVLVGKGEAAQHLKKIFKEHPRHGFVVVREYAVFSQDVKNELVDLAKKDEFDEIIQTDPNMRREDVKEMVEVASVWHRDFKYVADLLDTKVSNFQVMTYGEIPVFEIRRTPLDGWGRILKRVFDIIFSSIFIILFSPVMAATAIAIKLDSKGSVFFRYKRVGEKGKEIGFLKFRTMVEGAHQMRYDEEFLREHENVRQGSPMIKFKDDPRITGVGKFLRRWSIDEMPQFFLVFSGRMSLVGPRPHEIEEVGRYSDLQRRVLEIKPGITGMAQISGRSDLDFNEEVRLDLFYIENWSLKLDLKILIQTPLAVIAKRTTL